MTVKSRRIRPEGARIGGSGKLLNVQYTLTIAVGMGVVTALVSLMLVLGYRPLPFPQPERLVEVWERSAAGSMLAISDPDLRDLASSASGAFSALGGLVPAGMWLHDASGAVSISYYGITRAGFTAIQPRPVLGRGMEAGDAAIGGSGAAAAWISYTLWQSRYGGSKSVIGKTITLGERRESAEGFRFRVVGVLPPQAALPLAFQSRARPADVWFISPPMPSRRAAVEFGIGRLRPGITMAEAQAALSAGARRLGMKYPFDAQRQPVAANLEAIVQAPVRRTMGLLVAGAIFVLLVAFLNLSVLMLAEGSRRRREIAVRAALGAGPVRLWMEVFRQKLLHTLVGLAAGLGMGWLLMPVLARLVPAAGLGPPIAHTPSLNVAIALAFGASALAAAMVWSVLLVRTAVGGRSGRRFSEALASGGAPGADAGGHWRRWRVTLLGVQAALGVCLLAASALAVQVYMRLSAVNLGPAPAHTLILRITPAAPGSIAAGPAAVFSASVLQRVRAMPGTLAAARSVFFPPLGEPVNLVKAGDPAGAQRPAVAPAYVSAGYFRTLGIPLLFGRAIEARDEHTGSPPVAVINLALAERNWPRAREALGAEVGIGSRPKIFYRVIGVVGNFPGYWFRMPVGMVYLPDAGLPSAQFMLVVRTSGRSSTLVQAARRALACISHNRCSERPSFSA